MNPLKLLPLYAALTLTAACGQLGTRPTAPTVAKAEAPAAAAAEAASEAEARAKAEAALPRQPLTPELLLKLLVAEVAGQRGAIGIAETTYLELARQTRDPRVAQRAVEVSAFARDTAGALEATRLWAETDKGSLRAQQTLAALLLSEGRHAEAEPVLRALLQERPAEGFLHLAAAGGKMRDPVGALDLVGRLAADHPQLPEAQFAVAQTAANAGRFDAALAALQKADRLRPGWEPGALLHAQILARTSNAAALAFMRAFLAEHGDAREVRLAYARTLVSANQFTEARAEFARLTRDFPRNAEVSLAAGLLSLQLGDLDAAQALLTQTLEYGPRDPDTIRYYLGQTAEQMKRADVAAMHYEKVRSGNHFVPARARQAALLAQAGKHEEARALLAATKGQSDAQNVRLIQAQAELLRESKAYGAIFDVLSEGLKRYPDAPDLLYDRAMAAEKLGRLDVLEADLRRVIVLRPNDAQAYNALGYTLADRTGRLGEAIELLDKALALAPEDPFILDSVGWAQYRSGNLARARQYLERAYKARPDPEIAAHLGEVLWAQGQRDEAGKLWQASLQTHPGNEVLLETLRRLNR